MALERGVYTEDSLKERWLGVERVARRVANIGQGGGSLFSYGLSYLQSVLLLDLSSRSPSQLQDEVDPATFSPNDLVNLARHSLDRADLAQAVQYVTLLQGEPGRVARDWLEEARLPPPLLPRAPPGGDLVPLLLPLVPQEGELLPEAMAGGELASPLLPTIPPSLPGTELPSPTQGELPSPLLPAPAPRLHGPPLYQ